MKGGSMKYPFTLRAYDVPVKVDVNSPTDHALKALGTNLVHEVELGSQKTLEDAIGYAKSWSHKNKYKLYEYKPFPLHLIYITEWYIDEDGNESIVASKSYDEWEKQNA
jgi:hypothetical protein